MPAAEDSESPSDQKSWCQKLFLVGLLPCKKPVTDTVNVNAHYCAVLRCPSRSMENWIHYGMNPHPAGLMGIGNDPGYIPKSSYYMKIVNIKKPTTTILVSDASSLSTGHPNYRYPHGAVMGNVDSIGPREVQRRRFHPQLRICCFTTVMQGMLLVPCGGKVRS